MSRLGETNRGSPIFSCSSCRLSDESLFWASYSLAQARRARLSERSQEAIVPLFELSLRRKELAWAPSRLSETFLPERGVGRECVLVLFSPLSLYVCHMFGWINMLKAWNEWCACMELVHGFNMMSLVWFLVWNMNEGWL